LVLPLSLSDKWVLRPAHLTRELKGADLIRAEAGDLLRDNPGAALLVEEDALCGAHGAGDEAAPSAQSKQQLLLDGIHLHLSATNLRSVNKLRSRRLVDGQGWGALGLIPVVNAVSVVVDKLPSPNGITGHVARESSPRELPRHSRTWHATRHVGKVKATHQSSSSGAPANSSNRAII
jgi:hypothetical protein